MTQSIKSVKSAEAYGVFYRHVYELYSIFQRLTPYLITNVQIIIQLIFLFQFHFVLQLHLKPIKNHIFLHKPSIFNEMEFILLSNHCARCELPRKKVLKISINGFVNRYFSIFMIYKKKKN